MQQVIRSLDILASADVVWRWLASQDALRQWISPNIEIDLRVGGTYRFLGPDDKTWVSGTVLELQAEKSLILSWLEEEWLAATLAQALSNPLRNSRKSSSTRWCLNFKGIFFMVQRAMPIMNDGGAIVLNVSWTLHRAMPLSSVYSATKAAVHNLARTFATAFAPRRIRVNSISPGFINTEQFNEQKIGEERARRDKAQVPLARFGTADEIAHVAPFLASDEASYVTGQDFVVDGGLVTSITT